MKVAHPAYYRPSPRLPREALRSALLEAAPLAVLLGGALGALDANLPLGMVMLPAALLAGYPLSILLARIVRRGHLRHPRLAAMLALLLGGLVCVASWLTGNALGDGAMPGNAASWWRPSGWRADDGIVLGMIWLLSSIPAALHGYRLASRPYCERLRQWLTPRQSPRQFLYIDDIEGFVRRAEGNPADLSSLFDRPAESAERWARASIYVGAAGHDCYLRIDNVVLRHDRGDRPRLRLRPVLPPMRIDPYHAAALLSPEGAPPTVTKTWPPHWRARR